MTFEEVMANRTAILDEWAKRAEDASGLLNATGPILSRDASLWMIVREGDVRVYDLKIDAAGVITEEWRDGRVVTI